VAALAMDVARPPWLTAVTADASLLRCVSEQSALPVSAMHPPPPLQDKAVKRYSVRNMVDSGAMNDLKAACVYEGE